MVQPATTATTERAYAELGHWRSKDDINGWNLLHLMNSYLEQLDEVEQLYRDQGSIPGWATIMDIDTATSSGIAWLAQFVGVSIPGDLTEDQQRAHAKGTAGFKRGTLAAIAGAAQVHLTGLKRVMITERDTSAYHLTVRTYGTETPDAAAVNAALQAQKPAGLILVHQVAAGATYAELDTAFGTFADEKAAFATYANQTLWIP